MFSINNCAVPTHIFAGRGSLGNLPKALPPGVSKVLLVTGRSSMRRAGVLDEVVKLLNEEGVKVSVFDQVASNPTHDLINKAAEQGSDQSVDAVVGLGGGSAMDTAKAAAAAMAMRCDVWELVEGKPINRPLVPIVCIPSTAGTGSEVTRYSVISHEGKRRKEGIAHTSTIPHAAIIDPWVMSFTPADLTAYTGGDALAQAVEAYLTRLAHPYSDMFALEAIKIIYRHLPRVVRNGRDLDSRLAMGWASSLAGVAIDMVDVVIGHHVSEAVGALFHTHHGATAAALLPATMRLNQTVAEQKLMSMAQALELEPSSDCAIEAVETLFRTVGVPTSLGELGVDASRNEDILAILEGRLSDIQAGNPAEIDADGVKNFVEGVTQAKQLEQSYGGK